MMNAPEALDLMEQHEEAHDLYFETYQGIPIYRLFRCLVCPVFIKNKVPNFTEDNSEKKESFMTVIKSSFFSFLDVCRIILRRKHYSIAFFPSMRLFDLEGLKFDKFTDPIISEAGIESSSIILQRSYHCNYRNKRKNDGILCKMEVVDYVSYVLPYFLYPIYKVTNRKRQIDGLIDRIGLVIPVNPNFRKRLHYEFLSFVCAKRFYKYFLNRIKCNSIITVIKSNNYPQILAAHQLGKKAYEIQHGVTMSNSIVYGKNFNALMDPDAFLTFGEMWKGPQFGMPLDRIYNIGFAYKNYIKKVVPEIIDNAVLVVSSPEITEPMVNATLLLASSYPEILFYFRPHPHEGLMEEQLQSVAKYDNIRFSDKSVDSNIEVVKYKYVIGTNSSVLFEAASLGAKVGRLRFAGLDCMHFQGDENFCYIDTVKDFETFLNKEFKIDIEAYSDFNKELFLSLIN